MSAAPCSSTPATTVSSSCSTPAPPHPAGSAQALDPARRPADGERGRVAALVHFAIRTDDVPDGRLAYAGGRALHHDDERAGEAPATLMVIDTASDATVRQEPLDDPACPVHVAADGRVLVGPVRHGSKGAPADGQLTVLSPGGLAPLVTAPVGEVPITIRTTPDGEHAFIANLRSGTLHVVDLATVTVTAVLDIDPGGPDITQGARGIAYLP